jgi:hypothetical protein
MTYDHADMSRLSYSGAKILLEPGGPAKYLTAMTSPRKSSEAFDLGHAVHTKVLGTGQPYKAIDGNRNANAVKAEIAEAEAAGFIVIKSDQLHRIDCAAEAILRHPEARRIYETGESEVQITWDAADGTPMRGMVDWLNTALSTINDLKTAADASPREFSRACGNYYYQLQAATYLEAIAARVGEEWRWTWTVAELTPPYLVAVYEPDEEMLEVGRANLAQARAIWNRCRETGEWPGLPTDVQPISLPLWAVPEEEMVI